MTTRLWEVDHPYYCSDADTHVDYDSWEQFYQEYGDSDPDYNLVIRFDWETKETLNEGVDPNSADYHDSDLLHVYAIQQRRGRLVSMQVRVVKTDEPAARAFFQARFDYLQRVWEPFVKSSGEVNGS